MKRVMATILSLMLCLRLIANTTPPVLYKIISPEEWEISQMEEMVVRTPIDAEFVHLATEAQLPRVIEKFWNSTDYVVLAITPNKLGGDLRYEYNPGGSHQYYHLYDGGIPLTAVEEAIPKGDKL